MCDMYQVARFSTRKKRLYTLAASKLQRNKITEQATRKRNTYKTYFHNAHTHICVTLMFKLMFFLNATNLCCVVQCCRLVAVLHAVVCAVIFTGKCERNKVKVVCSQRNRQRRKGLLQSNVNKPRSMRNDRKQLTPPYYRAA